MEIIKDTCCGTCDNCNEEMEDLTILEFDNFAIDLCENCVDELINKLRGFYYENN